MKPQQALSNIEDYLSSFTSDVIGDNQEEFETLHTVLNALPKLIEHLEDAIWRPNRPYEDEKASIKFLDEIKEKLELE